MAKNVTLNFDHQIHNQLFLESKWAFVPNVKKFSQDSRGISRSQGWIGRTDGQHENMMLLAMAVVGAEAYKKTDDLLPEAIQSHTVTPTKQVNMDVSNAGWKTL